MNLFCVSILVFAFMSAAGFAAEPVKLIFDTDMDSDCDDVGALAMLHAMADAGEVELLACIMSAQNDWSARCTDAINTYFGRPDIPLGVPKGFAAKTGSKFAKPIAEKFPHDLASPAQAADAVKVYRAILSKSPDNSIVIVTVGDLTNIADLLKSPADEFGPAGVELAKKKVREWVCMGGNFVGHPAKDDLKLSNNNFTGDKAGSHYAVWNWPTKLMFVGREIGSVPSGLKAGKRLAELPESSPVRAGYFHYFDGQIKDRHVADQTAVLYAVRGATNYWDSEEKGYMDLKPDNTFEWKYDKDSAQAYLLKRKENTNELDRKIENEIEALMMHLPRK